MFVIYSLKGTIIAVRTGFAVIEAGGVGYKVHMGARALSSLREISAPAAVWCHTRSVEGDTSLYGFITETELSFFELLISVSGVGPKSALSILDVAPIDDICAAIKEGRPDLLTSASGIGRKTAERIIVELKSKVESMGSEEKVAAMSADADLIETLAALGYRKDESKAALSKIPPSVVGLTARLKEALKILSALKQKNL